MKKLALVLLFPFACNAGTLYLCKSYGGGLFWSSANCQTHKAHIERIVPMADGLPFDQQVRLGEQARTEGARLAAPPVVTSVQVQASSGNQAACQSLNDEIRALGVDARKLQAPSEQDRISRSKRLATSRRLHLKCA